MLVVTGDIIDNSVRDNLKSGGVEAALQRAYSYLTETLCKVLDLDPTSGLMVVPGNHDYRFKGLADNKFVRLVRKSFYAAKPSFDLFHRSFAPQFKPKFFPKLGVCLYTFDSNTSDLLMNFATGRVDERELIRFADCVSYIDTNHKNEYLSATRIALLHHHPMPIASTELEGGLTNNDSMLLLTNSGVFMSEMINKQVDIILHGHKHAPAFSKATFPLQSDTEHSVVVVGAGSAGDGVANGQCYNLITISDGGSILLERRERSAATYRSVMSTDLRTYEGYRKTKFDRLMVRPEAQVNIRKCTRIETIADLSGDVHLQMKYEGVTARPKSELRKELPLSFSSKSGFFQEPAFKDESGTQVGWRWEPSSDPHRKQGYMTFDPPIGSEPVSFTLERPTLNAIHFNQRDREDASGDSDESISVTTRNAYEQYVVRVLFPKRQFPSRFKIHVNDERGNRDYQEERNAQTRFAAFSQDCAVVLMLEKPIPDYRYEIIWDLPKDDAEEGQFPADVGRKVRFATKRLLQVYDGTDAARAAAVQSSLNELKLQLLQKPIGQTSVTDNNLEICLHAFSDAKSGLVEVASTAAKVETKVVPVGRTIIGQAYRRRALLCWTFNPNADDSVFWDYGTGHTGIISLPLFYPLAEGGRISVITMAVSAEESDFLDLIDRFDDRQTRLDLTQRVNAWYASSLAQALGLRLLSEEV
jgi:predicted phosphodiesterase